MSPYHVSKDGLTRLKNFIDTLPKGTKKIHLSVEGGSIPEAVMIGNILKDLRVKVKFYNIESAGIIPFMFVPKTRREVDTCCTVLLHNTSAEFEGKTTKDGLDSERKLLVHYDSFTNHLIFMNSNVKFFKEYEEDGYFNSIDPKYVYEHEMRELEWII